MKIRSLSLFLLVFGPFVVLSTALADDILVSRLGSLPKADRVVVYKSLREMVLFRAGFPLKTFQVALGPNPMGHKRYRGDGRTPEGRYVLDWRKEDSDFYRSIHVSYPNRADARHAALAGRDPGEAIMIHGLPNGLETLGAVHVARDWTNGCIAVTNEEMDLIWQMIDDGTPIELLP